MRLGVKLLDDINGVLNGAYAFTVLIANFDFKLFFESHKYLIEIKAIRAKILKTIFWGDVALRGKSHLVADNFNHFLVYSFHFPFLGYGARRRTVGLVAQILSGLDAEGAFQKFGRGRRNHDRHVRVAVLAQPVD